MRTLDEDMELWDRAALLVGMYPPPARARLRAWAAYHGQLARRWETLAATYSSADAAGLLRAMAAHARLLAQVLTRARKRRGWAGRRRVRGAA